MFTQTSRTFFGTFLFIIFVSTAATAQNFHTTFRSMEKIGKMLDSVESPHLTVNVEQPDKSNMKFRIYFFNPNGRRATITIRKKDDVYFSENIAGQEYASMYDFTQMEDGDYQVVVSGGKEKVCTNISIRTETMVNREAIVH